MIHKWFNLREELRFFVVTIANTFFRYIVFALLINKFGNPNYQLCLLITWLLSSFTAFGALKYLVFETSGNHLAEYFRSLLTLCFGYLLNAGLLSLIIFMLNPPLLAAQAIALCLVAFINYFVFRYFAFRKTNSQT